MFVYFLPELALVDGVQLKPALHVEEGERRVFKGLQALLEGSHPCRVVDLSVVVEVLRYFWVEHQFYNELIEFEFLRLEGHREGYLIKGSDCLEKESFEGLHRIQSRLVPLLVSLVCLGGALRPQ